MIGFFVWAHHMFVTGQSDYAALAFSFLSFLVAIPSAVKVFNWTATLYKGSISFDTPMLYGLGLHRLVPDRRTDRACSSRAWAWTSIFTTPTSWWRTSTTSWWAARSWVTSADCISGGPRSRGRLYPEFLARMAAVILFRWIQPDLLPAICSRATWACRAAITPIRRNFRCST